MVYLKNNNIIYLLNKELRVTNDKLYFGDKVLLNKHAQFYFDAIQKQLEEGKQLIDINKISYKESG